MADPVLFATNQSFALLVKEATRGTAPTTGFTAVAIKSPQVSPTQTYLPDEGLRGSPVTTYDVVGGTRYDMYDVKGDVHLDTWPLLIEGLMGGVDTVTGTAAPYTHTQPLLNSAATGSQPPSYCWQDFNGYITQQVTGAQCVNSTIDFTIANSLQFTNKYYGLINTTIGTPSLPSYVTSERLIPSWSNAVTIGGSASAALVDGSITLERSTEAVMTQGQQGPYSIFTGPLKVTGKFTLLALTSDPFYAYAYGNNLAADALSFVFTDTASTHTATIQATKAQFENTKYDRSKNYVQVTADFEAYANTTDTAVGFSPIKFITTNAVSTAS